MKKRGNLLKYFLMFIFVFGVAFLYKVPKVFADTKHDFSFKFYNCDSLDESKLSDKLNARNRVETPAAAECLGPNGDGVTPEITATNIQDIGEVYKIEPGKVIKVGVYYVPGTDVDQGIGFKFWVDGDSFEIVKFNKYASNAWSEKIAYTAGDEVAQWYLPEWSITTGISINDPTKITCALASSQGSAGTPMEDEGNLVYYYLKVKDDATTNTPLPFTWDTSSFGISMSNGSDYIAHPANAYVEVPLSEDNTLGTLAVKNGSTNYTLTPEFEAGSKDVTSYTAYIPNNVTSVEIEATPNDDKATLTGEGTKSNLAVGNNSYDLSVLSESGETQIYTVNVYRLSNDADLSDLTLSGIDFGTFDSDTTTYTATVPYTTSSTTVAATVHDTGKATASGTGNKNLTVGSNTISVEVTPENCKSEYSSVPGNTCTKKTYTVTVTREAASEEATLSNLKVDGVQVPGFDPETYTYTLDDVANNKSSVNITYETTDENATVTGDGVRDLSVGNNALDVVVTAQDGTTKKTYTINIKRKSNDNTLSSLTVTSDPAGTLSPSFDPTKTSYTYSVDANEDEVIIAAEASDAGATVTGTGTYNPRTTSSVDIVVTPEDGTAKTYTITFDVAKSDNANLSDLSVTGYTISPSFNEDEINYTLTVPSDVDKATIVATLADDRASKTGDGEQNLDFGENSFPVVVTAEDGTTKKTYTVKITREKKTDATLSSLKVDGVEVPNFDPETYSYTLSDVENDKTSVNITYETTDSDATVTGDGVRNLSVGDNALEVIVTAQDGTTKKTYTINIKRKSNDNSLKSLTVTSDPAGTLDPGFDPETITYTYSVDADTTEVVIDAEANQEGAIVTGTGTYNPRETSSVSVTVTPESGDIKTYTITFDVAKSDNADLGGLSVTGYTISPSFDPDETGYTLTVPSDVEEIEVNATKGDERQTISGTGTQGLGYGENTITVTVTAEDGTTTKDYVITVTREKKTDATLSSLKVDGVEVPNFDPETYSYTLSDVDTEKTSVNITYETTDSDATVTGDGVRTLSIGDNALEVIVTAQDGTTKKTYTINIHRNNSANTLSDLEVTSTKTGSLSPVFDPATTEYTYTTDPDETAVTITGTPVDGATVTGNGTFDPNTTSSVEVTVTAENGTSTVYTINLVKGKSTNADLDSLSIEGYTISPSFDKDELNYTLTVPSDVDNVTVLAELADDRATISGLGNTDIAYGDNPLTVTVTAEDGTTQKTYTVTVTRERKSDATLSDLTVDNISVPGFDPEVTTYDMGEVANDKTSITIGYTTTDTDATVSGTGEKELQVGDNSFDVVVTAHNGTTTKTYTITIHRNNDDSSLKELTVTSNPQGTLSPAFDPDTTEYTFVVDRDTTEVVVGGEPNGEGATISGTGTYNPQDDDKVEITVTSENGTTTVYTINLEKAKANDADLDSLEVEGYTISPSFDKDELNYTLTVPSDVDSVNIIATASDDGYATITGTGEKDLSYGANSFDVVVTAEDGTTSKTYTVSITRELSNDVKLSDLTIDNDTIEGFDPDVPTYTIEVGNDVTSITIGAEAQDDNAEVSGTGEKDLQVGTNTFEITVTAQDGTTGTYTVTVNRAGDDDNTLKELEVEGYDLTPDFDPNETGYTLTVPSDVDSVNIIATPNSDTATVDGAGSHDLVPGENTITVTVTAEDGTPKTYTITITKEEDDEKITSIEFGHKIEDGMIKSVIYKSVAEELRDQLDNENWKLHIFDKTDTEEISETDNLGTGMIIKLIINDNVKDSDILVIKGDINGDGKIKVNDVVAAVNQYLSDEVTLEGPYFVAADMAPSDNPDGKIKVNDIVAVVNKYLAE